MRKRIFKMIEVAEDNDRISSYYDVFMMITIIASLLPLTTKSQNAIWNYIERPFQVLCKRKKLI